MRILLLLLIPLLCSSQDPYKNIYTAKAWEARDKWQKPDALIGYMKISEGSQVADIGCHEGYMSLKLAKVVGRSGKVYAVDLDADKLAKLNQHAKGKSLSNIETVKGSFDDPRLPASALDAVIILDTYHEMRDHNKILQHVKTSLKPGGHLVICEPIADERRKLTRAAQEAKHEIAMKFVFEDLQKAGFIVEYQQDPFIDRKKEKGDKMWIIVAKTGY